MSDNPKRRWLRFSLRTLFVAVTMAATASGWGVWTLHRVREREALSHKIGEFKWRLLTGTNHSLRAMQAEHRVAITPSEPFVLWRMVGAKPAPAITFPTRWITQEELRRLEPLFPEATIQQLP